MSVVKLFLIRIATQYSIGTFIIRNFIFLFETWFFYSYGSSIIPKSKKIFESFFIIRIDFIRTALFECLSHQAFFLIEW